MATWHLTLAAEGRQAFFPEEDERRLAVRTLARVAASRLVLFAVVDEHVHLVVTAGEDEVGRLARATLLALRQVSSLPIDPARARPVRDRPHLESLVDYVLGQPGHHGIPVHPALWTGSCFPDLVGARVLPGFRDRLGDVLPRLPRQAVFRAAGLPPAIDLPPAGDDLVRSLGACRLRDAATAALAVGPQLAGRTTGVVLARAAACRIAQASGIARAEIVHALGLPLRTAQRLVHYPVEDSLLDAVRRRLALEELAARHPVIPSRQVAPPG
jgi:REP element-mobilizing transposase RayT